MTTSRPASILLAMSCMLAASAARAAGDVFDQFFRYTEREHKVYFAELPGETVDPFTGTLSIVQTDLVLPGKAGLDVRVVRSYSSKIWGRSDLVDIEPLLAEKERSPLGYGWTFHLGRLRNPYGDGTSGYCSGNFPIFEGGDGSTRVFYPTGTTGVFLSKDYWRMEQNCLATIGAAGACIWSSTGTRYEFRSSNQFYFATTPVWPVSAVVDSLHTSNRIAVDYVASSSGAVSRITDTYGRQVNFTYTTHVSGATSQLLLDSMDANGNTYTFTYTLRQSACSSGCYPLPGSGRFFLTQVQPPAGPPYQYAYADAVPVAQNQYALRTITYPWGGTTAYTYGSTTFFTGYDSVPFAVVTQRVVAGRGVTNGTWSYSYSVPGSGSSLNVTNITRPDGKVDRYSMYGLGYVLGLSPTNPVGNTWMVGLTREISLAGGAEVETRTWQRSATGVSAAYFGAPVYSACAIRPIYDAGVFAAQLTQRQVARDGATYTTSYSSYDAYGQPRTVSETGMQSVGTRSRSAAWTYDYVTSAAINWVRGRPLTKRVTVGSDIVDNSWTYYGSPSYAKASETLAGVTTTFAYDADGNLSRVTNALGQDLTLSGYTTGYGIPTTLGYNGAFTVSRTARWEGWLASVRNGRGYTTSYTYDGIGRLTRVTPPGSNAQTNYAFSSDGYSVTMTRGPYSKTTNLDGLGRTLTTSDSEGVLTSTRYDNMSRVVFQSYPYSSSIGEVGDRLVLDGLGRPTTRTRGFRYAAQACDVSGACDVTMTYSNNCVTTTVYRASTDTTATTSCSASYGDPQERLLQRVTDGETKVWQYAHNGHGDLTAVTAPLAKGNRSYGYFATTYFPRIEVTGESGTTTFGRNAIGQMTSRTDARSISVTYGYNDPLSRLKTITYGSGSPDNVTRSYDEESNVTQVASTSGGTSTHGYDDLNRMTSQTWSLPSRTYTTSYSYDSYGCLRSMTYPTGTTLTMTCDSANRTTSVAVGSSTIVSGVTYHPSGQPGAMSYGNGRSTSLVYDYRGRATSVTSASVLGLTYTYDGADNVRSFNNTQVANSSRTMTYDKADRILTSIASGQWGSAVYSYDELGNRTLKSETLTTNYTFDSSNRLATAAPPSGATAFEQYPNLTLTWDSAGRLTSTSDGAAYLYEGRGRRVQKSDASGTTLYHYDAAGRVIAETRPDGTKLRDYVYLGNRLVAVDGCLTALPPNCTQRQWYHVDTLGTPLARTDSAGVVTARFDYKAWGEPWSASGAPSGDDRQYNGRVLDSGTGFVDYGARMYWPQIGRFISADTVMGEVAVPQSLNRYAYVLDNPYRYTDPNGRWPREIHEQIIDRAFPGLSEQQRLVLKDASRATDAAANQTRAGNHMHAMRSPGEDPSAARQAIDARIAGIEASARRAQGALPKGAAGVDLRALSQWGGANHTVMDRTSPTHTSADGSPMAGSGIPTSRREYNDLRRHMAGETTISPEEMNVAVEASRASFRKTFGEDASAAATAGR